MQSDRLYPTRDGIVAAIETLQQTPVTRDGSTLPVLLAIEGSERTSLGDGTGAQAVPNAIIEAAVNRWFGVAGDPETPYFLPFPMQGATAPHWRSKGSVVQSQFTSLTRRNWVGAAVELGDQGRGYPLKLPADWVAALARSVGAPQGQGLDLAALGVWLARRDGLPATTNDISRDALVSYALERFGIARGHELVEGDPAVLGENGPYVPRPEHFGDQPLEDQDLLGLLRTTAPPPTTLPTGPADEPPPQQVVRTTLAAPDPPLEIDDRVRRMFRIGVRSTKAVMLVGPPGTGKTSIVAETQHELLEDPDAAKRYGLTSPPDGIRPVTPDDDWSAQTLIGGLTLDDRDKLVFRPGHVLEAIRANEWLLLDEANRGDLDKIFGGLLTWLAGQRVVVGPAHTGADAPSVVLEWSREPRCEVVGYHRLASSSEADTSQEPIVFRAGTDWRLLGTYNPVDAQRVFKLGQALSRRFRHVPMPPIGRREFAEALDARAPSLDGQVRGFLIKLYEIHRSYDPPLGPAPFLDLADHVGEGLQEHDDVEALTAEAYVGCLGSWLSQLDDEELDELQQKVGNDFLTGESWEWLREMRRTL